MHVSVSIQPKRREMLPSEHKERTRKRVKERSAEIKKSGVKFKEM